MKLIDESSEPRNVEVVRHGEGNALPAREIYIGRPAPSAAPERSEWAHFAELSSALSRRKTLVVLSVFLGLAVAAAVTIWSKPVYRASASLEVQGLNEDFLDLKNVDSSAKSATFSAESYIQTQAEILQEDVLLERVVNRLRLAERPSFQPKPGALVALAGSLHFLPPMKEAEIERPLDLVRRKLLVTPSAHSRIIKISYESTDRQLSADLVNALTGEFIDYNLEARLNAANQIGRWLGPELQEMKDRLNRSESELSNSSQSSGLLLSSATGTESVAEEKLRNLQRELAASQADRIAKESLYRVVSTGPLDSLPAALDTPSLKENQIKLTDLRRQRAELSSIYTDDNYRVAKVQAQIEELEAAITRENQNIPKRVRSEYDAAMGRELMLAKAYDAQASAVGRQAGERIRFETLKRAVDSNRQIYESTLLKVNEAGIASAIKPSGVRLIGAATPPIRPHRPNLPLNLSIGMAAGLCVGLVSAASMERNRRVLRGPNELRDYLDVPLLGAIPAANDLSLHSTRRSLLQTRPEVHLELVSWEEKRSLLSESFQEILASLVYSDSTRVLLVTSALPGEGKTTIASNLSIGLAQIGKRVLLVDGDLRRPRLHEIFNQPNTWGLSNALTEKNSLQDLPVSAIVKKTAIPGLSLLPSGPATEQLANLLYSPRMQDLMTHFRQEFDYIILDAPPALQFADSRILARYADAVAVVARANRTHPDTVREALERFRAVGVPILGTILNDFKHSKADQSRYGYGYGYRN